MTDRHADLRPIIVAEHASARFGGEALLPLNYFRLLRARGIETWMVVHERTRAELEELFPHDRDRLFFVRDTWTQKISASVGGRLPKVVNEVTFGPLLHTITQVAQRRILKELVAKVGATIVHEPIPVSPRAPSLTFGVGAPVLIGPMNGGMAYPQGFPAFESGAARRLGAFTRGLAGFANAVVPGKRKAAALLVANERTARALPPGVSSNVIELVENGVDLSRFDGRVAGNASPRARPRFVFLGRLVDWKAVDLLLRAIAEVGRRVDLELHVVGDGPERARLQALTDELGLRGRIVFRGFVPQAECPAILADSDGLILPSLYECGGAVVLEAMAMSLPVIATNWGGPADYVDETCGILVEPRDPAQFVAGLASAVETLAKDPALRRRLGEAGRRRVEAHFDWARKIDRIIEIYRDVQRRG